MYVQALSFCLMKNILIESSKFSQALFIPKNAPYKLKDKVHLSKEKMPYAPEIMLIISYKDIILVVSNLIIK